MKKMVIIFALLSMVLILSVLTSCNSNRTPPSPPDEQTSVSDGPGSDAGNNQSDAPPREEVRIEDLPADTILIFQSKTKQLSGRIVDGSIKIPFFEFVEDMGYAYDEDENTITIHNNDLGVSHVVEIGSNVVITGDAHTVMLSTLDYLAVDGQDVLFVPTSLYSVFEGNY